MGERTVISCSMTGEAFEDKRFEPIKRCSTAVVVAKASWMMLLEGVPHNCLARHG